MNKEEYRILLDIKAEYELRCKYNLDERDYKAYSVLEKVAEIAKKQIPTSYKMKYKETVRVEIDDPEDVDIFTFHCPCCDEEMGDSDWDGMPSEDWISYCPNCGQKIDWVHDVNVPQFTRKKTEKKIVGVIN